MSFVILGIISTAVAQIFLKRSSSYEILGTNWILCLFLSLSSYAISFLTYYLALRYYDISKISPIMMASIVSLVAVYGFYAGEQFNFTKLFGIVLAAVSVFLISRS
jgi:drug/metabolite transporter (DMT)-like permease